MNKTTGALLFVLGAAVGSALTWQYTKKYYEQRAQEEIDSVKEAFSRKSSAKPVKEVKEAKEAKEAKEPAKTGDTLHYSAILKEAKYASNDTSPTAALKPYVISPDEFGEFDEYEQISLTYYADQVLADEDDEQILNVDEVVGTESLTHFGEYEDDSVFVRNDRLKCDYEILMDARTYSEVTKKRPHPRED